MASPSPPANPPTLPASPAAESPGADGHAASIAAALSDAAHPGLPGASLSSIARASTQWKKKKPPTWEAVGGKEKRGDSGGDGLPQHRTISSEGVVVPATVVPAVKVPGVSGSVYSGPVPLKEVAEDRSLHSGLNVFVQFNHAKSEECWHGRCQCGLQHPIVSEANVNRMEDHGLSLGLQVRTIPSSSLSLFALN